MWKLLWRNHAPRVTFVKGFQYTTYEYQYYDGLNVISLEGGKRFLISFPEIENINNSIDRSLKDD